MKRKEGSMLILIVILLLIVLVFGAASGMQSYASAKQAEATIETAKAAQVNAWGNLIVIMLLALVIVCVLALVVWMVLKRSAVSNQQSVRRQAQTRIIQPYEETTMLRPASVEMLMQLKMLEILERMSAPAQRPQLEKRDEPMDMEWLRRQ